MNITQLTVKLNQFRSDETVQQWQMYPTVTFSNEYVSVYRVDTSNKAGGQSVQKGKQWSIIIDMHKEFTHLNGWKELKTALNEDIEITPCRGDSALSGKFGIRLKKMSNPPNQEIIIDILNFIFS